MAIRPFNAFHQYTKTRPENQSQTNPHQPPKPAPGPAEVFDLAAKAVQAGYRVTQAELQERTGYALEAAGGAPAAGNWEMVNGKWPAPPALNRRPEGAQDHLPLTTHHLPVGLQGLAEALQADCAPLAKALQTLLDHAQQPEGTGRGAEPHPDNHLPFTNYHLRREAAALAARLPELLPEDPELAAQIRTLLDDTFAAESANGDSRFAIHDSPAATAASNRAPRDYKRDKDGKFSKTNHPGTHQREGETPSKRDAHGTFDEAKLAADTKANAARARSVVTLLMAKRGGSEPKALYRQDTGWVGIDYGEPGNKDNAFAGGHGLAHILAKHPEAKDTLVDTLLTGDCYKHHERDSKLYIVKGENMVVLSKHRTGRLLITDFIEDDPERLKARLARGKYHVKGEN